MAVSTREGLKEYALRNLGAPVVEINVDDDQLEDRIDDTFQRYRDYHYDGTEEIYLAHQVTANNITDGYVDVSDNIIGVTRILPISSGSISSTNSQGFNIFDINYSSSCYSSSFNHHISTFLHFFTSYMVDHMMLRRIY